MLQIKIWYDVDCVWTRIYSDPLVFTVHSRHRTYPYHGSIYVYFYFAFAGIHAHSLICSGWHWHRKEENQKGQKGDTMENKPIIFDDILHSIHAASNSTTIIMMMTTVIIRIMCIKGSALQDQKCHDTIFPFFSCIHSEKQKKSK